MPGVTKSVLVPFSAQKMYDLVVNCEDYPAFLPWCAGGRILEQKGDELSAELKINFKGIQQSFSTRNRNVPGKSIEMALLSGPFKSLRGHWRFTALAEDACRVEFELEYHSARFTKASTKVAVMWEKTGPIIFSSRLLAK